MKPDVFLKNAEISGNGAVCQGMISTNLLITFYTLEFVTNFF